MRAPCRFARRWLKLFRALRLSLREGRDFLVQLCLWKYRTFSKSGYYLSDSKDPF